MMIEYTIEVVFILFLYKFSPFHFSKSDWEHNHNDYIICIYSFKGFFSGIIEEICPRPQSWRFSKYIL